MILIQTFPSIVNNSFFSVLHLINKVKLHILIHIYLVNIQVMVMNEEVLEFKSLMEIIK